MIPRKILVIQLRRVGDVIFTLPVIGALRKNFPESQIDFLVEKPAYGIVRLNAHLNETLVYDQTRPIRMISAIRSRGYDWVLDFLSNGRTWPISFFSGAPVKAALAGPAWRRWAYTLCVPTTDKK